MNIEDKLNELDENFEVFCDDFKYLGNYRVGLNFKTGAGFDSAIAFVEELSNRLQKCLSLMKDIRANIK